MTYFVLSGTLNVNSVNRSILGLVYFLTHCILVHELCVEVVYPSGFSALALSVE